MYTKEMALDIMARVEDLLDADEETQLRSAWLDFCHKQPNEPYFNPRRKTRDVGEIPKVLINEALFDKNAMIVQQFGKVMVDLKNGSGNLPAVRCNYGSSIAMSLFDVEMYYMDEEFDTLPTSYPTKGGLDDVKRFMDAGIPDLNKSLSGKAFEMAEYFLELLEGFPKLKEFVYLYHPDYQGPLDICEVLLGSDMFYYVVDEPELMVSFLGYITDVYEALMDKWLTYVPYDGKMSCHWGFGLKGAIALRDDSAMNLSPAMFAKFVAPFDGRLLDKYGGTIHFCGKGDHYIEQMSRVSDKLFGINLSQPHLNDMSVIINSTTPKGVRILRTHQTWVEEWIKKGYPLNGLVHVSADA